MTVKLLSLLASFQVAEWLTVMLVDVVAIPKRMSGAGVSTVRADVLKRTAAPGCPQGSGTPIERIIVTHTVVSMTATATAAPAAGEAGQPKARHDGAELLAALVALPAGHPSRPALRERTITAFAPLARHLAARYHGRGEPLDDLIQTAAIGLI